METVQECLDWNDQTCLSTKEDRSIYNRNNGTGGEYEFSWHNADNGIGWHACMQIKVGEGQLRDLMVDVGQKFHVIATQAAIDKRPG